MTDTIFYINTEARRYPLVFNLNVMEEMQEKYGSLQKWADATEPKDENGNPTEPNIKDLKFGLLLMINEGIEIENEKNSTDNPLVTSKQVGRILSEVGIGEVVAQIKRVTVKSTKVEGDSKNE